MKTACWTVPWTIRQSVAHLWQVQVWTCLLGLSPLENLLFQFWTSACVPPNRVHRYIQDSSGLPIISTVVYSWLKPTVKQKLSRLSIPLILGNHFRVLFNKTVSFDTSFLACLSSSCVTSIWPWNFPMPVTALFAVLDQGNTAVWWYASLPSRQCRTSVIQIPLLIFHPYRLQLKIYQMALGLNRS